MDPLIKWLLVGILYRAYLEYKPLVELVGFGRRPDRYLLDDTILIPGFLMALVGFDTRLLVVGIAVGSGLLLVDFSLKRLSRNLLVIGLLWFGVQSQFQPLILGPFIGMGYGWYQRRFSKNSQPAETGQIQPSVG
jgi:hypothetical protein